ncbi:MAG: ribosome maturation factor RimP [Acidimicrobiales bacterium]
MAQVDTLHELFAPVVAHADAELVDVEFGGGNLIVTVDCEDGLSLSTITTISKRLSLILDEQDLIPGRYTLQVSSPGLERALKKPEQFSRAEGEMVAVSQRVADGSVERLSGTLTSANSESIELLVENTTHTISYDAITKARTIFEWGPAPKPGSSKKKKATS